MSEDPIQKCVGAFGRYQVFLCFLIFLSKIFIAVNQLGIIFLNPNMDYVCTDTGKKNGCPCNNPKFDHSLFEETIKSKWKLICGRTWMGAFNQTSFQFGTLIGSIIFGMISDRFGRKWPMVAAGALKMSAGLISAFVPDYWAFTFLRFIIGVSVGGTMVIGFVILVEFIGKQYVYILAAVYQMPFNIGHMSISLLAYYLRSVQKFQLGCAVPAVVMLLYICFVPETPRWLIAMRKTDRAVKVLEHAAKFNKLSTASVRPNVLAYQAHAEKHQLKKGTIIDLFRYPNLRRNTIAMSIQWLACSYSFYGVSQYVGQLTGDAFSNNAIGAFLTMIGTALSIPAMMLLGRRTIVIVFNLICAISLFILAFIPVGIGSIICAVIGEVSSFIVFVLVYLYTSELFPTVVRNASMGYSSMLARVGSMIAPFVVDLKTINYILPPLLFGIVPFLAALICFLLPETKGHMLMTTIAEGEAFKAKSMWSAKVPHSKKSDKGWLESLMCWR